MVNHTWNPYLQDPAVYDDPQDVEARRARKEARELFWAEESERQTQDDR